jgi:hypothetical protein
MHAAGSFFIAHAGKVHDEGLLELTAIEEMLQKARTAGVFRAIEKEVSNVCVSCIWDDVCMMYLG